MPQGVLFSLDIFPRYLTMKNGDVLDEMNLPLIMVVILDNVILKYKMLNKTPISFNLRKYVEKHYHGL